MIRVIAIDDSAIALQRLEEILEATEDIRLLRGFRSLDGVSLARELSTAQVLLVDMLMPGRSGMAVIRDTPRDVGVVVVSDAPPDGQLAREALRQGAAAFVSKRELGSAAGEDRLRRVVRGVAGRVQVATTELRVLCIAGSTGAHRALEVLVPGLVGTTAAVVVAEHLPEEACEHFAGWLGSLGLPTQVARGGERLEGGRALLAPSRVQMVLEPPGKVTLRRRLPHELHTPCADSLLSSAAFLGPRLTAVVLSGMGRDGAAGVSDVLAAGGRCIVQAPEDCVVPSMPLAALSRGGNVRSVRIRSLPGEVRRALET